MAVTYLFDEVLLDPTLFSRAAGDSPLSGWPEYMNTFVENPRTGARKTNVNRAVPLWKLTVDLVLVVASKLPYFLNFWCGGAGSAYGFRCRVPWDYVASLEAFAVGNGSTRNFQLYTTRARTGVSGHSMVRPIIKPVVQLAKEKNSYQLYEADGATPRVPARLFKIYFGVTEQTTGWTVDCKTGVVTFTTAPTAGTVISWSGEFDIAASFDGNAINHRNDSDTVSRGSSVRIREMPPWEIGITPLINP